MKLSIEKYYIGNIPILEVTTEKNQGKALPLIVYYHGWQSSKELNQTQAKYLAEKGFRVVLPDAYNHGERKQNVSDIPSLTFWQSVYSNLFEFEYIIKYYHEKKLIKGKIGVGGISMGGMTTSALLTHHPEIDVAACIMGSPKLLEYKKLISKHSKDKQYFLPKDYDLLLNWIPSYDLSLNVETLSKRPVLFWHGTKDNRVPYHHTLSFIEENGNTENLFFISEDVEHLVIPENMKEIACFFDKHMH